jgi:CHASE3 domain sensor protein
MEDFIKAIVLVIIFFFLILFSAPYLSNTDKSIKSIPFVNKTFQILDATVEWFSRFSIKNIDSSLLNNETKNKIENLLPSDSDAWINLEE